MDGSVLSGPTAGSCDDDSLTVATAEKTAAQLGITALCGAIGGQHLYLDVSTAENAMSATVNINTNDDAGARKWKLLVRRVECNDEDLRAPSGCSQYHTATSGRISSFNGAAAVTTTDSQYMLKGLRYNICIRRATGVGAVTLREAGGASDSFKLDNAGATDSDAMIGADCDTAFLLVGGLRYC